MRNRKNQSSKFEDHGPSKSKAPKKGYVEQHTSYAASHGTPTSALESTIDLPLTPSKSNSKKRRQPLPSATTPGPRKTRPIPRPWQKTPEGSPTENPNPCHDSALDHGHGPEPECGGSHSGTPQEQPKAKRARTQADTPLLLFADMIDTIVDEVLRLEGPGTPIDEMQCYKCSQSVGTKGSVGYRCRDCSTCATMCRTCLLKSHQALYLHRIEEWTGYYFRRLTLKDLGVRIQLGHPPGEACRHKLSSIGDDFVIIDVDGIHSVSLDYCDCADAQPPVQQLLRARLFPATTLDPNTAATFKVLETFQMLSFTAKTSAHEFLQAISRRSDNTGMRNVRDRYHEFLRIIRVWRHIRLLKRGGRGHDDTGVAGTLPGELAVLCPACPLPNINMPEGWEKKKDLKWLHSLFIGIDANFRLRRKDVSSNIQDPGFNKGYAYLVEELGFKAFIDKYGRPLVGPDGKQLLQPDKSNCSNHDAIKSASSRGGKGLAATGLANAQCSRHDMRRPTSCGDLQLGKRYVNMDYVVLETLRRNIPKWVTMSYDIGCQWFPKLDERCNIYDGPNPIKDAVDTLFRCLVPKFHLPAHIVKCQVEYSFNLTPGVGRTDGEAPERAWADSNLLAYSTREMGPGSRRDTLDDSFGHFNWAKVTELVLALSARAVEAIARRREQVEAFEHFSQALPRANVVAWTKAVQDFEQKCTAKNPYEPDGDIKSETEIRLQLAKEDGDLIKYGNAEMLHPSVSPSVFIYQGLEIEDAQRRYEWEKARLGSHGSTLEKAKNVERGNNIRRRFDAWEKLQLLYMPSAIAHRQAQEEEGAAEDAGDIALLLPSAVPKKVPCTRRLVRCEFELRIAQAHRTLRDIRGTLLMQAHLRVQKDQYGHGTRYMTRSNQLLADVATRLWNLKKKYDDVRVRIEGLSVILETTPGSKKGTDEWRSVLRVLEPDDIKGLTSSLTGRNSTGDGFLKLTWIWTVSGSGKESDDAALRIEFCRARARAHRWQEECLLLNEELARVRRFFGWDAARWEDRGKEYASRVAAPVVYTSNTHPRIQDRDHQNAMILNIGKVAYSHRQAGIRRQMEQHARTKWEELSPKLTKLVVAKGRKARDDRSGDAEVRELNAMVMFEYIV